MIKSGDAMMLGGRVKKIGLMRSRTKINKVSQGRFQKKIVRNFPHFSGMGGFEKVIFCKKYGLLLHKIT